MIVVAVVAILAAIAYPSYQGQARKARYADAKVKLLEIMQEQRKFFTDNNSYTEDLVGVNGLGYPDAGGGEVKSEQGKYNISADQCDAGTTAITQCVELTATPQIGVDEIFTYNSRNEKTPATHW